MQANQQQFDAAKALFLKGLSELQNGNWGSAERALRKSLEILPSRISTLTNLISALIAQEKYAEAWRFVDKASPLDPNNVLLHINIGILHHAEHNLESALRHLDQALRMDPDNSTAHLNKGKVLRGLNDIDGALEHLHAAVRLAPDSAETRYSLALCLLLQGDYQSGWELYESRWNRLTSEKRAFNKPLWLGKEKIRGKAILLHSEQGLGDSVQFCRYVNPVAELGADVTLLVQSPLLPLLRHLPGVINLVDSVDLIPSYDFHCPLMSLPLALEKSVDGIPNPSSYITVTDETLEKWSEALAGHKKPRVAIAWRGNPNMINDNHRSAKLADIAQFLSCDIDWLCLHHDLTADERLLLKSSQHIKPLLDENTNLEDAAALCALSDIVLTVDTSFGHIAGALGKPTFIMLGHHSDWRWQLERTDTPWYSNTVLYRQDRSEGLASVASRASADIEKTLLGR